MTEELQAPGAAHRGSSAPGPRSSTPPFWTRALSSTRAPVEADLARRAERRVDMTMRQRADDGNGIPVLRNHGAAFEQRLEAGDPLVRPVGEVQQGALLDLARLAVALAQQDGRRQIGHAERAVSAEQFHARLGLDNAIRLSG